LNALKDVNELLATRCTELNEQAKEAEEQAITEFLKQATKEDRILFKKMC